MLGLRRAVVLGLPRVRRGVVGASVRRSPAAGLSRWSRGREALGGWEGAGASPPEAPQETFVFPEYLPEKPAADVGPVPAPEEDAPEPEPGWRDARRWRRRLGRLGREASRATGEADPSVPSSGVSCSGCGAELHCQDAALAGYLPRDKYLSLVRPEQPPREEAEAEEGGGGGGEDREAPAGEGEGEAAGAAPGPNLRALEEALCQRCWLLTHYQTALRVQLSPEEYRRRVSAALRSPPRHGRPSLVLYMADLLDLPDSVLPDLPELVGNRAHVFVLGNKADLLPGDSPKYLGRLRARLLETCVRVGLVDSSQPGARRSPGRVVDVHLISARTGYGVEELISKLQSSWKFNGDVYLVGSANTGKSTLFNTLLHSDYCKSKASDIISRATVSPWPGTTLNLLKFPIIAPTPYRIFQRRVRLQEDAKKTEDDLSEDELKELHRLKRHGYLIGRVGRTFKKPQIENPDFEFDAEAMSYGIDEEPSLPRKPPAKKVEFTEDEVKFCNWLYDTPGIIRDGCILNLLNEKEVKLVLPTKAIVPRTFLLKPGMTLFLGALGRIDYVQGGQFSWFSVIASNFLPVHITALEKADAVYQKHAGEVLLKVPIGGKERMKDFPPLVPHDVVLEGIGDTEAVADIKLSSAGWVAVTAQLDEKIHLKCYTPEGTKLSVRQPPLLPYIVQVKGKRMKRSPAYETIKPPSLVQNLKSSKKSQGPSKSKV